MAKISGDNGKVYVRATGTSITAASHAAGTVTVTASGHGYVEGDFVDISGVVGMTDLNGIFGVSGVAGNDFDVTLTTAQSYTSGGTARQCVPVTNWELVRAEPVLDATDSSNAGWRQKVVKGIKNWTGSLTGLFYLDSKPQDLVGESFSTSLVMDDGRYFTGSCIFGEVVETVDIPGESLIAATYSIEGNGLISEVAP